MSGKSAAPEDSWPLSLERRIDAACQSFEAAWQAAGSSGTRPRIEDYLPTEDDPGRWPLLQELLKLELYYRRGEHSLAEELARRFPECAERLASLVSTRPPVPESDDGSNGTAPQFPREGREPPPPRVELPSVPGHEVLGELGRGGMGVVYRARHVGLNRVVALKMIRAGVLAGDQEIGRFRAEAEAVARLQHPNIVQVYEVGEQGGLPYFSLELCAGGDLATRLGGAPLPAGEAAKLVETLARAMHAAHQAGIVHRDLKPANVLLVPRQPPTVGPVPAGGAGVKDFFPKITDFGLAKKLGERGQTQSGAILGTPSYMAPEQAAGRSKEIGPAADVYALGAIFYELLTGRPPFRAATDLETVLQVIGEDPVPPRLLEPRLPRDVQTICLACLQKEPARRYATALDLAGELRRFLEGKPILRRPVGQTERAAKWARRNPALAVSSIAGTVILLGGTVVSMYFAVDAARQAEHARNNETQALMAKTGLENANRELETTLARSLLRPLDLRSGPLTDSEIEALSELAGSPSEQLGYRFVEEALRSPLTSRQLRARAEPALQAAVGLDTRKRAQAERLLVERLQDPGLENGQLGDMALVAVALGDLAPPATAAVAKALTQALAKRSDPISQGVLARALSVVAARMEPGEAARVCAEAAATLARALDRMTDPSAQQALAEGLAAVAGWMEPAAAARVCASAAATLTDRMVQKNNLVLLMPLAKGLSTVAARMEPAMAVATIAHAMHKTDHPTVLAELSQGLSAVAARMELGEAAAALTETMVKTTNTQVQGGLASVLSVLAARMEPGQATATLTQAMAKTSGSWTQHPLARGLWAAVARMEPAEATRVCASAAATFTQALDNAPDPRRPNLAEGLSAVAARMEPAEGTVTLTHAMTRTKDSLALQHLAESLSAVAERMEPAEAAATLAHAMTETANPYARKALAQGLSAVAARTEPTRASRVCAPAAATLTQAMAGTTWGAYEGKPLAEGLSALTARMAPAEAAATLTHALGMTTNPAAQQALAEGLSAVAARMEPAEAAATLTQAMDRETTTPPALKGLAEGLSAVAGRMEPAEASRVCASAAATLIQAMDNNTNPHTPKANPDTPKALAQGLAAKALAEGLAAVAARMEPGEAARACAAAAATLTRALDKTADRRTQQALAEGLSAVAGRMEPAEASRVCASAAATLIEAMDKTIPFAELDALRRGLSALALRMETTEAVATLTHVLDKTNGTNSYSSSSIEDLARCLSAVVARMRPAEAAAVLVKALGKTTDSSARRALAEGLLAEAERMEPAEAAATLAQAMTETANPYALHALAECLSAVAGRMEPGEGARVCAPAAASLTQAMGKPTDLQARHELTEGLSRLAARMEPGEAATALIQGMAKTTEPYTLQWLAAGLSAVLTRPDRPEVSRRSAAVLAAVGTQAGTTQPVATLAALSPALEPVPCRFATPDLVELLKQPTCTGAARRAILDQLGNRYHRSFADHWEFVRFAQQQHLGLDFTSPPKRLVRSPGGDDK
jgi:serine/threonine protein kinase